MELIERQCNIPLKDKCAIVTVDVFYQHPKPTFAFASKTLSKFKTISL